MSPKLAFRSRKLRTIASSLAAAGGCALLAGCALEGSALHGAALAEADSDALASTAQALIGGTPATADHFRSTVGINDDCTAAKVGPRLFLTAAHCVAVGRPGRGAVPVDFPPNNGIRDAYLPGMQLRVNWGLDADDAQQAEFAVVATSIHPSWWACPLCQDPILGPGGAADIAVVELAEDTPEIPEAAVELDSIGLGTPVVKVGWGCEERTNVDPNTLDLGRYKREDASIISVSEIQRFGSPITDGQVATVDASYLITAGHAQQDASASLCLGDSGGPLYLPDNDHPRIVGVNSNYAFPPLEGPDDLGGVSWTDWHTRTSLDSIHGVGEWLIGLGVNTVGGDSPASDCSCPQGCDSVQPANVPFTQNGVVDRCFFFEQLGYGLNSHSMVEVNLNGQDVTNRWVGNWSYPAERDGGYYLYLKGQEVWSWAQVVQ